MKRDPWVAKIGRAAILKAVRLPQRPFMALHRDIFRIGRQWAVTGFGIQAVDQRFGPSANAAYFSLPLRSRSLCERKAGRLARFLPQWRIRIRR